VRHAGSIRRLRSPDPRGGGSPTTISDRGGQVLGTRCSWRPTKVDERRGGWWTSGRDLYELGAVALLYATGHPAVRTGGQSRDRGHDRLTPATRWCRPSGTDADVHEDSSAVVLAVPLDKGAERSVARMQRAMERAGET